MMKLLHESGCENHKTKRHIFPTIKFMNGKLCSSSLFPDEVTKRKYNLKSCQLRYNKTFEKAEQRLKNVFYQFVQRKHSRFFVVISISYTLFLR